MYRRAILPLVMLSFVALPAAAQFSIKEKTAASKDPKMYTIDDLTVKITDLGPVAAPADVVTPEDTGNDPLVVIDHIMNIGARAWQFMLDNQAVVTASTTYATALPEGVKHWSAMEGWERPKGTLYGLTAKNAYGMTVVDIRYMVMRTTGGSYEGKGKYLTAVSAQTMPVSGTWGYRVSLDAAAPDSGIVNAGTKLNPVAAMSFNVGWRIETAIKKSQGTTVYYVRGDGVFQPIGGSIKSLASEKAGAAIAKTMGETLPLKM